MNKKIRKNPFEFLRLSPVADKQEIIEMGKELAFDASPEERKLISQAVSAITIHPMKCLEYQVFTYADPEYDSNWNESEKEFLYSLTALIRKQHHQYELEFGLLKRFHQLISQDPLIDRLRPIIKNNTNSQFDQVWSIIIENNKNNCWFLHNLALLHQEWAEEFEEQKNEELASFHWKESRKYWFEIYPKEEFWNYFGKTNIELSGEPFTLFLNFPNKLLDIHSVRLNEYLQQKRKAFAQIHFNCIKLAQQAKNKRISSTANAIIENLTSKFLREAKEKSKIGKMPEGIRENYESAINQINSLLDLDPNNKRVLMFVVEQYNSWGFDLYTIDDKTQETDVVQKSKYYTKKLASQITKGQGFLRENQIVAENLLLQGHVCTNLKETIALFTESLEYNPDYENAKRLLDEAKSQIPFEAYEKILKEAKEAWESGNDTEVINSLKKIPSDLAGYDEVKKFLAAAYNRRGVNSANNTFQYPSSLGALSIDMIVDRLETALKDLENALDCDPYNKQIRNNLNGVRQNLKKIETISGSKYKYRSSYQTKSRMINTIKNFLSTMFTNWWFWLIIVPWVLVSICNK